MNAQLTQLLAGMNRFWAARDAREKLILTAGFVVIAVALYVLCITTLNKSIAGLERKLPELLLNNYEIAAGGKAAGPRAARNGDLRSDLFKVLADRGLKADLRALSTHQVEMRLPDQDAKTLLNDLNAIRLATDAHIVSLQLRAADKGLTGATATLERAP